MATYTAYRNILGGPDSDDHTIVECTCRYVESTVLTLPLCQVLLVRYQDSAQAEVPPFLTQTTNVLPLSEATILSRNAAM